MFPSPINTQYLVSHNDPQSRFQALVKCGATMQDRHRNGPQTRTEFLEGPRQLQRDKIGPGFLSEYSFSSFTFRCIIGLMFLLFLLSNQNRTLFIYLQYKYTCNSP
ncbi:unnamed protein product [Mycena citricolor]|uniref:Uncharacterized protein n=1 Tax=Mycena citricolor TaxID=2018698 RepID=A0AAD2Q273_9AGAR|nr:unnamed protein product [Mycena citricolor]